MYKGKYYQPKKGAPKEPLPVSPKDDEVPDESLTVSIDEITLDSLNEAPAAETPATPPAEPLKAPEKKEKRNFFRKPRLSTIIFYTFYVLLIAAFFVGLRKITVPLEDWLTRYEASQPEKKCEEVFEDLFSDPDWEQLYRLAGIEDTTYEGSDAFVSYMEAKAAGKEITYVETSAGLSGDHKYIVKLDGEKIGTFTLTGGADSQTEIPEWEFGTLELFYTREEAVTVEKLPGYTVSVNGVALDDTYTIRTVTTGAEKYLPEGLHGYRLEVQTISGFLIPPEVTVADENGNPVVMNYDAASKSYTLPPLTMEMTEAEQGFVKTSLETFAKYMIKAASKKQLAACCVPNSEVYNTISAIDRWMQDYLSYEISPITYRDFYRYSDTLFSVRAAMTNRVTRFDGSVKNYEMDYSLFFTLDASGKWLLSDMTQVDIAQQTELVRMTFLNGETVLDTFFVDTASKTLTLPAVTVPEGMVFSGWARQEKNENGKITMTIVFKPDETNTVVLSGEKLTPMTLYALFEKGEA